MSEDERRRLPEEARAVFRIHYTVVALCRVGYRDSDRIYSFPNRTISGSVRRMNGLAVRILPYVLAFFSSLCIMILELVSSRLVARHVGRVA